MNKEVTDDQIRIIKIQQAFIDAGWQWQECIYNDGHPDNCSITFAKSTDPVFLSNNILGDYGWGRFSRIVCWNDAYNALINGLMK